MTKKEKLIASVLHNPKAVRFDNACKIALEIGFTHHGSKGSHSVFKRNGEPMQLNFQSRNGFILPYQARQLAAMLNKYGEKL